MGLVIHISVLKYNAYFLSVVTVNICSESNGSMELNLDKYLRIPT